MTQTATLSNLLGQGIATVVLVPGDTVTVCLAEHPAPGQTPNWGWYRICFRNFSGRGVPMISEKTWPNPYGQGGWSPYGDSPNRKAGVYHGLEWFAPNPPDPAWPGGLIRQELFAPVTPLLIQTEITVTLDTRRSGVLFGDQRGRPLNYPGWD